MKRPLHERVGIVTDAGGGIGSAATVPLAKAGTDEVAAVIDHAAARATVTLVEQ